MKKTLIKWFCPELKRWEGVVREQLSNSESKFQQYIDAGNIKAAQIEMKYASRLRRLVDDITAEEVIEAIDGVRMVVCVASVLCIVLTVLLAVI